MSQVLSGLRLGPGISLLYGGYDPNNAPTNADAASASVDWIYFRLGTGSPSTWLYRCSVSAVFANGVLVTPAVWVAK